MQDIRERKTPVRNKEYREKLERFSELLRERFDIKVPIENMQDVISRMGGVVRKDVNLPPGKDGTVTRTSETNFELVICSDGRDIKRDNFAIAHMLGHMIFDMGFLIDDNRWSEIPLNEAVSI